MLKIGDFSRISQVTIKALRLYDTLGLLQPASIDPFTNYRYYTLDQLADIHRIVALKEMGLSLDEIRDVLSSDLPLEQLRGMLRLKQAELHQRIDEETMRLRQAEFRLRQLELEENMPTLDVVIKKVEPFYALTVRATVSTRFQMGDLGREIQRKLEAADFPIRFPLPPDIPLVNIFYGNEYLEENIDAEYCMPIDPSLAATFTLDNGLTYAPREVPGVEMAACYVFKGDYDAVADHYPLLQRWIAEQGYTFEDEIRYVYLRGNMHNEPPANYVTEIQARISKP
ncbi:MAG: MerR family transcriptional regulator [Chloroflexota bacterium]